jgi:hypothetical protein
VHGHADCRHREQSQRGETALVKEGLEFVEVQEEANHARHRTQAAEVEQ